MKRKLTLSLTLAFSILVFTAVTYTSCKKDACKDVTCQNGGTCADGKCTCPTEYGGPNCETKLIIPPDSTSITYQNKTYTPITITLNGATQIIPVGGSATYTGPRGAAANGSAYTSGTDGAGNNVGIMYNWASLSTNFPANSTLTIPLSVSSSYFFVKVINKSTQTITKCYGNYGLASQIMDVVNIPNDGATHNVGYYNYSNNSNVRVESATKYWLNDTMNLAGTSNQAVTFTVQ